MAKCGTCGAKAKKGSAKDVKSVGRGTAESVKGGRSVVKILPLKAAKEMAK